jgi:hypothetical protein
VLRADTTYMSKVLQLFNDGEAIFTHIALVGRKYTARLDAGVMMMMMMMMRRRRRRRRLMVEEAFDVM